jgi:hypothetical protein
VLRVRKQELSISPWIFKMICEVTGVDILTDKPHSWYKPNKGNIERLLSWASMPLLVPLPWVAEGPKR